MIDFHPPPLTLCTGDGEFGVADQFLAADAVRMRRRDADCGADDQFASVDTEGMGERFLDKAGDVQRVAGRSEEHTSELQSLMRTAYAVSCVKKKTHTQEN